MATGKPERKPQPMRTLDVRCVCTDVLFPCVEMSCPCRPCRAWAVFCALRTVGPWPCEPAIGVWTGQSWA
eukprot:7379544-Prymnesium_polylepis.1